ncbi:helix-turn-helix transcriptional regulator [Desulfurivibrio sp. D14AmB]|uniref:helix-turn-helix transcriptional regulator n=1 Tax=Desulfurivibrio sp. D14AmB TaxID=3374370 RepID=UPI00376F2E62
MPENKSQLARLLFIDDRIRRGMASGRLANCSSLAGEYEVSTKTIQRDIEFLRERWNAPLAYDQRRRGFYYREENYGLPALHVNEGEMVGLLLARRGLEAYRNTPIHDSLVSVFKKLAESLPDRVSVDAAWLGDRISVLPEQHTIIDPESWHRVCRGLQQNSTLAFNYRKPGAASSRRRQVDPYHLAHYQGGWYLLGHCHTRRQLLTFALSRISAVEPLADHFLPPADFNPEESLQKNFGIFMGNRPCRVSLFFSPAAAPYVAERVWHPEQTLRPLRDGGAILTLPAADLTEIRRWVLSWGSQVKVLGPEELVQAIRAETAATLARYHHDSQPAAPPGHDRE